MENSELKTSFARPLVLVALILFSAGCITRQARLPWDDSTFDQKPLIVRGVEYDRYGRPLFQNALKERPGSPGERFTLVFSSDAHPVFSVDVAVFRRHTDAARPFKTLYAWTGKGFKKGADVSEDLVTGYLKGVDEEGIKGKLEGHLVVVGAIMVVPVTVGTTTGFVIGLGDGAVQAVKELRKAVVSRQEYITSVTRYEYEGRRLMVMRMFSPDLKTEVVRTTFLFREGEEHPFRTVIHSFAENRDRVLEPCDEGTSGAIRREGIVKELR